MELSRQYAEPSRAAVSSTGTKFSLATDVDRPGVFLDAKVRNSTEFARAMLVMHKVVCSNLLAGPRDHSAYQEWVQGKYIDELSAAYQQYLERLDPLMKAKQDLASDIKSVQRGIDDNPLSHELKQIRDAQRRFFSWLWDINREAWIVIDPVVSVQPDCVLFEGFSLDESTYARVSMPGDQLDHQIEQHRGTTNIDFGEQLAREFARVRSYRPLRLQVGAAEVSISTEAGAAVEKKIDLPDSWVKGFLEVQSAAALSSTFLKLSSGTVADVIDQLMRKRERHGPRSLRFHLQPGLRPVIEIDPWGIRVEEPVFEYEGDTKQEIRIWGRRRLLVLRDILTDCDQLEVRLLGSGMPSFWSLRCESVQLDLGLSGWTSNDWASQAKFEQLAAVGSIDEQAITSLAGALKGSPWLNVSQAAESTGLDRAKANKGLQQLCARGLAIFDPHSNIYRWRELFPPGFVHAETLDSDERDSTQSLLESGSISITAMTSVDDEHRHIEALVSRGDDPDYLVAVDLDMDGRAANPSCTCGTFKKFALMKGPCRHLRAALILADKHSPKSPG